MADTSEKADLPALVVGEVVDAIRQQDKAGQININILIQRVTEKAHNPTEIVEQTERALAAAEKWEQKRLQIFRDQVAAVIEAKTNDPDEVEKRQNNRIRRWLKALIGLVAVFAVGGGVWVASLGGSIVVATLLLLVGVVSIAMLGPLASGESVSAADMVQIILATRKMVPTLDNDGRRNQKKRGR